jgi:hypothetical protein
MEMSEGLALPYIRFHVVWMGTTSNSTHKDQIGRVELDREKGYAASRSRSTIVGSPDPQGECPAAGLIFEEPSGSLQVESQIILGRRIRNILQAFARRRTR